MPTCLWQSDEAADLQGVRCLRHQLAGVLEWLAKAHRSQLSRVQCERILLIQTELMTNSVKYSLPHSRYIGFQCWQSRGRLWLEWYDDGGLFNALAEPQFIRLHLDWHGHGLFLIQFLAPGIRYRAVQHKNCYWLPLS